MSENDETAGEVVDVYVVDRDEWERSLDICLTPMEAYAARKLDGVLRRSVRPDVEIVYGLAPNPIWLVDGEGITVSSLTRTS